VQIDNVSFIVIARNEEFGVDKCLSSLAAMDLRDCEVICVDSGSSDKTVAVMCSFRSRIAGLRVVIVKGYSNAAVARNAGLTLARKDAVFFVDGDVEINPSFLVAGLARLRDIPGAVTGRLRELRYTRDFTEVIKEIPDRFYIEKEERVFASGGCFLASRCAVATTGLFDERLERSQDYDYTLRLSHRFPMFAIPVGMGTHHTIGYEDKARFATHIKKLQAIFFGTALRRNLSNLRGIFWLLSHKERGIALGGLITAGGAAAIVGFGFPGVIGVAALVAVDLTIGIRRGSDCLYRLYLHYLFPLLTLAGCLLTLDRRRPYTVEEVMP
jgi:glycosyltransferase involved in cell wall biosynthesis